MCLLLLFLPIPFSHCLVAPKAASLELRRADHGTAKNRHENRLLRPRFTPRCSWSGKPRPAAPDRSLRRAPRHRQWPPPPPPSSPATGAPSSSLGSILSRQIMDQRSRLEDTPSTHVLLKSPCCFPISNPQSLAQFNNLFSILESVKSVGFISNTFSIFTKLPLDLL